VCCRKGKHFSVIAGRTSLEEKQECARLLKNLVSRPPADEEDNLNRKSKEVVPILRKIVRLGKPEVCGMPCEGETHTIGGKGGVSRENEIR